MLYESSRPCTLVLRAARKHFKCSSSPRPAPDRDHWNRRNSTNTPPIALSPGATGSTERLLSIQRSRASLRAGLNTGRKCPFHCTFAARPVSPTLPPVPCFQTAGGHVHCVVLTLKTANDHATRRQDVFENHVMSARLAARYVKESAISPPSLAGF